MGSTGTLLGVASWNLCGASLDKIQDCMMCAKLDTMMCQECISVSDSNSFVDVGCDESIVLENGDEECVLIGGVSASARGGLLHFFFREFPESFQCGGRFKDRMQVGIVCVVEYRRRETFDSDVGPHASSWFTAWWICFGVLGSWRIGGEAKKQFQVEIFRHVSKCRGWR